MPDIKYLLDQAKKNAETWKDYKETEKDKKIYSNKRVFSDEPKKTLPESDSNSDIDECVTKPPSLL